MHVLLPLLAIMNTAGLHTSIASLLSGISGNPNSPITIAGVRTDTGTLLVGGFAVFMVLMGVCFSPRSDGKGDRSPGLGFLVFIVFVIGMYAIGLMAH